MNYTQEIWSDIVGYENMYQISNYGRLKSFKPKEKILSLSPNKNGYIEKQLYKKGKYKSKKIHRLVAEAFIPNPNNLPEVNHKDGDKTNNCVNNLEWVTTKQNNWHRYNVLRKTWSSDKRVVCIETGKIYNSITIASKDTNINDGSISKVCHNKRKTAGGYHWRFYDELS